MIHYTGKAFCKSLDSANTIYEKLKEIPNTTVEQDGKIVYVIYEPTEYTSDETEQKSIIHIKKTLSLVDGQSYFCVF